VPLIDATEWRLTISGVRQVELSLDEIRALPRLSAFVTMECAGNGRARLRPRPLSQPWINEAIGTAEWTGTSLWPILERAGLPNDAIEWVFTGADRGIQGEVDQLYERSLTVEEVNRPQVLLAYEMNGRPLEPQHGFPLRLIVPGWYGMTSVKWLTSIRAVTEPFKGYQQSPSYHYTMDADSLGDPVTRIRPRALLVPPGFPDFFSRHRFVERGETTLFGRAWCGNGSIERVEVGVDGEWRDAVLGPSVGEFAWRSWTCMWDAQPGEHVLSCRATDSSGEVQPEAEPWNYQGLGNNAIQTVAVTVR
jgi:DMSO/TMAO reductase YedYZ molybdopterin-dependent catalytic subunit